MRRYLVFSGLAIFFLLSFNSTFNSIPISRNITPKVKPDSKVVLGQGLSGFWNTDYKDARASFALYMKLVPDDPVGDWRSVMNDFFELRHIQEKDEVSLDGVSLARFIVRIDKGVEKCEVKLAKGEDVSLNLFVEASLYGIKALLEKANDGRKTALDDGAKSMSLAFRSKYPDYPILTGLMGYIVGRKHWYDVQRIGAPIFGFPNNLGKGLAELAAVKENNGLFSDDIRILIFQILTDYKKVKKTDRDKYSKMLGITAEELYNQLKIKHPKNELILKYSPGK